MSRQNNLPNLVAKQDNMAGRMKREPQHYCMSRLELLAVHHRTAPQNIVKMPFHAMPSG